jgi:hypothetical protein
LNTLTFLSYPKYYKDADQKLTLVKTNLVESGDPQWDYEVTTGIWTLRVRTDGTFQAEHQGDVFSYQLSGVGVGRGEAFSAFDWGTPVWKNYQIMGDTIRWSDVFPDVDLSVRYIHDILKVDVIVKAALMNQIRGEVQKGNLNAEDYLTARFDIPGVWVSSEARQAGEKVDLYTESLDVKQPLQFVKDDKVIHQLRPVETYVLDQKGEPIITFDEQDAIRSAQTWRLKQDAAGVAEMSAHLGDLAQAPEGDVVIDPPIEFGVGTGGIGSNDDSFLDDYNDSSTYGSLSYLKVGGVLTREKRALLGFNTYSNLSGRIITSAKLRLNLYSISGSDYTNKTVRAHKVTDMWYESAVSWVATGNGWNWSNAGGDYEATKYCSKTVTLPSSVSGVATNNWVDFDVSYAFKSHYLSENGDTYDKGFLIKMVNLPTTDTTWYFRSSEYTGNYAYRPELVVEYGVLGYGAHVFPNEASLIQQQRIKRVGYDQFDTTRYLDEVEVGWLHTFCYYAKNAGLKVFIHSPIVHWATPDHTKTDYADHIYALLYDGKDYIDDGTIIGIEIGGEEPDLLFPSDKEIWLDPADRGGSGWWFGDRIGGASCAEFYLAARERIKNSTYSSWDNLKIWSGGSPEKHESLAYNDYQTSICGSGREFLKGFIARVIEAATEVGKGYYDYAPDAIPIHGYVGPQTPEYTVNTSSGVTEWFSRVDELYGIFNPLGLIPNFAVTEYGFSAEQGTGFGPSNASTITQAVYYLRSCLMNSTMQPYDGIGFMLNSYFEHNEASSDGVSFHNNDNSDYDSTADYYYGSYRPIKYIARALFSNTASPSLKLQDEYTKVWVPLASEWDISDKGYAYCGWETSSGTKWGAIWRYDRSTSHTDFSTTNMTFWAPQSAGMTKVTNRYQFTISSGLAYFPSPNTTDINGGTPSGGKIPFVIPGVDENPIILEFSN